MKNILPFCKDRTDVFSSQPIEENSVLFLESYRSAPAGDCRALLAYLCGDNRYDDWKIYWAVPGYKHIDDELQTYFGDRIELVKLSSVRFLAVLETARYIFASAPLPSYYVRREGQCVTGMFPVYDYRMGDVLDKKDVMLFGSLNKCDLVWTDSARVKQYLKKRFRGELPFSMMDAAPPRGSLSAVRTGDILVSVSNDTLGKDYASLEQHYKQIKTLAVAAGRSVTFRIDHNKWLAYQEENDPKIIENLLSSLVPACRCIRQAELVITDQLADFVEAIRLKKTCILMTRKIPDFVVYRESADVDVYFANSWRETGRQLGAWLDQQGQPERTGPEQVQMDTVLQEGTVCEQFLQAAKACQTSRKTAGGILLILSPKLNHKVWDVIADSTEPLEVLFRGEDNGALWRRKDPFCQTVPAYCHFESALVLGENSIQEKEITGTELPYDKILPNEWKRVTGNRSFQEIIFVGSCSKYWELMMECAPCAAKRIISEGELTDVLLSYRQPALELLRNAQEEEYCEVDGVLYIVLGRTRFGQILLRQKETELPAVLADIRTEADVEACRRLLEEEPAYHYYLYDPHRLLLEETELTEREQVSWLPMQALPLRVFAKASGVALTRDGVLNRIAGACGKERIGPALQNKKKETMTSAIGLLAVRNRDAMIDLS